MSFALLLAAVIAPSPTATPPVFTPRAEWRLCTRESVLAQLRSRPASLEHQSVVDRAFNDCAEKLKAVSRTQSAEDIQQIQDEQRKLIRQDVEIFYWDNVTGHI